MFEMRYFNTEADTMSLVVHTPKQRGIGLPAKHTACRRKRCTGWLPLIFWALQLTLIYEMLILVISLLVVSYNLYRL